MVAPGTRNPPDVVTTEIAPRAGPVPHYFPLFYRESTNIQVFSITMLTHFCRADRNGPLRKKLDLLRSSRIFRFFDRFFFDRIRKKYRPNFFRTRNFFRPKKISINFFFSTECFFRSNFFSSPGKNQPIFFSADQKFFGDRNFFRQIFFSSPKLISSFNISPFF